MSDLWKTCPDCRWPDDPPGAPACPTCAGLHSGLVRVGEGALLIEDVDAAAERAVKTMNLLWPGRGRGMTKASVRAVLRAAAGEGGL